MAERRHLGTWEGLRALDEVIDGLHERLDGPMPVIASDVVVELLPEPLDDVGQWRVGRQEVEHHPAAQFGKPAQGPLGLVDDEVVEHQVDALLADSGDRAPRPER